MGALTTTPPCMIIRSAVCNFVTTGHPPHKHVCYYFRYLSGYLLLFPFICLLFQICLQLLFCCMFVWCQHLYSLFMQGNILFVWRDSRDKDFVGCGANCKQLRVFISSGNYFWLLLQIYRFLESCFSFKYSTCNKSDDNQSHEAILDLWIALLSTVLCTNIIYFILMLIRKISMSKSSYSLPWYLSRSVL